MPFVEQLFEKPRLRSGVRVKIGAHGADIEYRTQGCTIGFEPEAEPAARALLSQLAAGGRTTSELRDANPSFAPLIDGIISDFDRLGLLTESDLAPRGTYSSGTQCMRELVRFADRMKAGVARSTYLRAMREGRITRSQLIGYALEYWHFVHSAPAVLAPALGNVETRESRKLLTEFYLSELRHDRMLAAALATVRFPVERLEECQPLPMTFALIATLGALARQHPLAFKAVLFLFEEPYPEFNTAFLEACRRHRIPNGFARPIVEHSQLNEAGEHDAISAELLKQVPLVSAEEQLAIKKHVAVLVEQLVLQENEILRYYERPRSLTTRFFS